MVFLSANRLHMLRREGLKARQDSSLGALIEPRTASSKIPRVVRRVNVTFYEPVAAWASAADRSRRTFVRSRDKGQFESS